MQHHNPYNQQPSYQTHSNNPFLNQNMGNQQQQQMNQNMGQQQMNQNMGQQQNQNQNQNKIKNPKTQVPNTPQMNDRDFSNDMLTTEKYMTAAYSVALNEASHQSLYEDLKAIFNETQDCQRDLYNLMFRKGWYNIEPAQQQKLQQDYQNYANYASQIPYHQMGQ